MKEFFKTIYQDTDQGVINVWTKDTKTTESFDITNIDGIEKYKNRSNIYYEVCLQRTKPASIYHRGNSKNAYVMPGLWFDIDIAGTGHTKSDLPKTFDIAIEFVDNLPVRPTLIVNSGGGLHLYYLFREPWVLGTEEERQKAANLSLAFQQYVQFRGREYGWNLDNTSDLARLLRVPNTKNAKNGDLRDVEVIFFDDSRRYNQWNFDFVEDIVTREITERKSVNIERPKINYPLADIDPIISGCPWIRHCYDDAETLSEPEWFAMLSILGRCHNGIEIAHEWSKPYPGYNPTETEEKLKNAMNTAPRRCDTIQNTLNGEAYCGTCQNNGQIKSPINLGTQYTPPQFEQTDLGNAKRLVYRHGKDIRYCPEWKNLWVVWNGKQWEKDTGNIQIQRRASETVEAMATENGGRDHHYAVKCQSANKIQNMIKLAKSENNIPIRGRDFDQDLMLFNCQNGTIDLKTGELLPHQREHLITKISPVEYNPHASRSRFMKFLDEIMCGDQELISYLKRVFGYALTGDAKEQAIFFLYGNGSNGKTKLLEAISAIMGDYAATSNVHTFLQKKNVSMTNDIARLNGARFVIASEADKNNQLSEALVKKISGDETMASRYLFQEEFEYRSSLKLFLPTNHDPKIDGVDDGIWRRIHKIPFNAKFEGENRDLDIEEKLRKEFDGILAWCVEGCLEWQREGLNRPEQVIEATKQYRIEQDFLEEFITEKCVVGPDLMVEKGKLYEHYRRWKEKENETYVTKKLFGSKMKEKGFKDKKSGSWHWIGLDISK